MPAIWTKIITHLCLISEQFGSRLGLARSIGNLPGTLTQPALPTCVTGLGKQAHFWARCVWDQQTLGWGIFILLPQNKYLSWQTLSGLLLSGLEMKTPSQCLKKGLEDLAWQRSRVCPYPWVWRIAIPATSHHGENIFSSTTSSSFAFQEFTPAKAGEITVLIPRINCAVLHGLHSVLMTWLKPSGKFALNGTANAMEDYLAPKSPSWGSTKATPGINTGKGMKRLRADLRRRTLPKKNRLRGLGLFSWEKRSLWGDLRAVSQCFKGT